MQTKEIISTIFVHGAQDSSSFILLHEHSAVFNIIYTNCPGNVCPGKWLSGKRLVREIIDESAHADVRQTSFRETSCPGKVLSGKRLSGKVIVRETSVTPSMYVLRWTMMLPQLTVDTP